MDLGLPRAVALAISVLAGPGAVAAQAAVTVVPVEPSARAEAAGKVTFRVTSTLPDTVRVQTAGGTATPGDDFTAEDRSLTFVVPGSQDVDVAVKDDAAPEADETIQLTADPALPGETASATAAVLNDDDPPLVLSVAPVREGAAKQGVALGLIVPTTKTVTVKLATFDGTAKAGQDFTATTTTVTFAPGTQRQDVEVPLLSDDVFEGDEAYGVGLLEPANAKPVAEVASAAITEDDPAPLLTIEGPEPLAEGNRGETKAVPVRVRLSAAAAVPAVVGVTTLNGTATSPVDYTALTEALVFAPGETEKTVTLTIRGDDQLERDQRFSLLAGPLSNVRTADGQPVGATITIRNDDRDLVPPAHTVGTPRLKGTLLSAVVACPAGEDRCDGRLTFFRDKQGKLAERRLGARDFKLAGGKRATVRVRLSKALAAQARGRKVTAYALASDASGNRATARRSTRRLSR